MTSWSDMFNTYEEACEYYGADTPAQIAAEIAAEAEEWRLYWVAEYGPYVADQDAMECPY